MGVFRVGDKKQEVFVTTPGGFFRTDMLRLQKHLPFLSPMLFLFGYKNPATVL